MLAAEYEELKNSCSQSNLGRILDGVHLVLHSSFAVACFYSGISLIRSHSGFLRGASVKYWLNGKASQTANGPGYIQNVSKTLISPVTCICPSVCWKIKFIWLILLLPGRQYDDACATLTDKILASCDVRTPPVDNGQVVLHTVMRDWKLSAQQGNPYSPVWGHHPLMFIVVWEMWFSPMLSCSECIDCYTGYWSMAAVLVVT